MIYLQVPSIVNERAVPGVVSVISVAISTDNTVVWFVHWEDGYDTDVTNFTSTRTEIWGDGNAKNGCAPEVNPCTDATDRLEAGNAFVIQNTVALPAIRKSSFTMVATAFRRL